MAESKNNKITTIKLKKETKDRLDHLKEFSRESYDEIVKKMLYILNTVRTNPETARGILRNIDLKSNRKHPVYSSIPAEAKQENPPKISEKTQGKIPMLKLNKKFRK